MAVRLRNRLSTVELLPEAATPALQVAYDAAKRNRRIMQDMCDELNQALRALSIKPVSISAFSRWVLRVRESEIARPVVCQPGNGDLRAIAEGLRQTAAAIERIAVDRDNVRPTPEAANSN